MLLLNTLQEEGLWVPLIFLLGLFVGSFLNVCIYRLPIMLERSWKIQASEILKTPPPIYEPFGLALPRSRCPHCGHKIHALENIPILSYIFLRGKCSECKTHISVRYPLVELLTAVLSAWAASRYNANLAGIGAIILTWALVCLAMIDIDTQLLPDDITLPLIWAGLFLNIENTYTPLQNAVIGAMAGYLCFWSVNMLCRLILKKEGMGYGDFKLMAAIGAWLGWAILPLTILLSSAIGAVVGITLIIFKRHKRNTPIPFGPYIAVAGYIALLYGQALNDWYLLTLSQH